MRDFPSFATTNTSIRHVGHGFCGNTRRGDGRLCSLGDRLGSWRAGTLQDCAARCQQCPRCHFISFSSYDQDCSWFNSCPEVHLQARGLTTHETYSVWLRLEPIQDDWPAWPAESVHFNARLVDSFTHDKGSVPHYQNWGPGMRCNVSELLRSGAFIRSFECREFGGFETRYVMPVWNITYLERRMPDFLRAFYRCALEQTFTDDRRADSQLRGALPTSYIRSDLPIKSYADNFGFLLQAGADQVACAYPLDAYSLSSRRLCSQSDNDGHVQMRLQLARRKCQHANPIIGSMQALSAQGKHPSVGCCNSVENALTLQRAYLGLEGHTRCTRGNGLNQMNLRWSPDDVQGVYFIRGSDAKYAAQLHRILTAELMRGTEITPSLMFCRLPSSVFATMRRGRQGSSG
jgi:hypothetical protein|uniref:Apple domain-containing protein n=1 Tax=Haptolina ericina TaxID=156174 RepID=A0A7S3EVN3_9EUKA|mmetsp:Transcript_22867/g.51816  ORF Transcript_22867/g.51816 Transcript_22867/m.51816 type:complete len:404 (+) Transcript_22867:80-1291(+)